MLVCDNTRGVFYARCSEFISDFYLERFFDRELLRGSAEKGGCI